MSAMNSIRAQAAPNRVQQTVARSIAPALASATAVDPIASSLDSFGRSEVGGGPPQAARLTHVADIRGRHVRVPRRPPSR